MGTPSYPDKPVALTEQLEEIRLSLRDMCQWLDDPEPAHAALDHCAARLEDTIARLATLTAIATEMASTLAAGPHSPERGAHTAAPPATSFTAAGTRAGEFATLAAFADAVAAEILGTQALAHLFEAHAATLDHHKCARAVEARCMLLRYDAQALERQLTGAAPAPRA